MCYYIYLTRRDVCKLKKDRNCMMPYPVYPPYQGMNPMMAPIPIPVNQGYTVTQGVSSNTLEQQVNTLQQQINSLENRVNNLESMIGQNNYSNAKYNSSNFQMM